MSKIINNKICVWKVIGNLERIRLRERGGLIKPNKCEKNCEYNCEGFGIIRHRQNNVNERCRNYMPNFYKEDLDLK